MTDKEFKAADPDNDGTLSKDEYLAMVEKRFKAVDPDNRVQDGRRPVSQQAAVLILAKIRCWLLGAVWRTCNVCLVQCLLMGADFLA